MASNFLDKNGLLYFLEKLKGLFVQKDGNKVLSTNDYTNEEKAKLAGIAEGADVSVNADWNATQGKAQILNKPSIPSKVSDLTNDTGFITADDVPEGVQASNTSPKMDGVASVGTENAFARGDHTHPSDDTKADADSVYTKTEIDGKNFAVQSTTLAGYGINDAYTKTQIDSKLSSVYKPGGSLLFAELPQPSESNLGYVYNMEDEFTTDDRFLASEPVSYPIGTNVVVVTVEGGQYKFDVLAGFVDLSDYVKDTDIVAITNQEIDTMFAS